MPEVRFVVQFENRAEHRFQVEMVYEATRAGTCSFAMPAWTPGYYQMMDFAGGVTAFKAFDASGTELKTRKNDANTWCVETMVKGPLRVVYDVQTDREFVAESWIDSHRAYLVPGSVFLYPVGEIELPVRIDLSPVAGWPDVATGLKSTGNGGFSLYADNFDVLYDSPILVGKLESLPAFDVRGVPHYFTGYELGDFDRQAFMDDLKKLIEAAVDLFGEVPYEHYTFIGIGPGRGGIEHLNSTAVSFDGDALNTHEGRLQMLSFLTHEYFHHFNVKRIRPVELGPFDYQTENRTNMLWVSEGLTVYYEYLMMKRSGLFTEPELLEALGRDLAAVEGSTGRLFQTLAQASWETWSDGPFGRIGDEVNKTISYYQKGPVVGWLFDFKIREATGNQRSLDDVMRRLYTDFYQAKNRGFTEAELRQVLEETAGQPLDSLFAYIYTIREPDYNRYLNAGGYAVDTTAQVLPGAWFGASVQVKNDTALVRDVEWQSPAWKAGIRRNQRMVGCSPVAPEKLTPLLPGLQPGDVVTIGVANGSVTQVPVVLSVKKHRSFAVTSVQQLTQAQQKLREAWLGHK